MGYNRIKKRGEPLYKPEMREGNPIRLYTRRELGALFAGLDMDICGCYGDFTGAPASDRLIQLLVCSQKRF